MFNSESWKYDVNQPWAHLITALNPRDLTTDSLDDLFIQVGTVRQADKKLEYIRWIEGRGKKRTDGVDKQVNIPTSWNTKLLKTLKEEEDLTMH